MVFISVEVSWSLYTLSFALLLTPLPLLLSAALCTHEHTHMHACTRVCVHTHTLYWLLFCYYDKIPDINNLREEEFIWAHGVRGQSPSQQGSQGGDLHSLQHLSASEVARRMEVWLGYQTQSHLGGGGTHF